jgi:peptidoglycan/xylan/chitin deacetylase (PgdA/CDA1 family)
MVLMRYLLKTVLVLSLIAFGSMALLVSLDWFFHGFHTEPLVLSGDGCLVLAYHRVIPRTGLSPFLDGLIHRTPSDGPDDYTLYSDTFELQLRTLKAAGARFITAADLERVVREKVAPQPKCVLITLDDADISQYEHAFPLLQREHIPFVLFTISGQVGSPRFNGLEMATWPQIREMLDSGLATLASHTHDLHRLDSRRQAVFLNPQYAAQFRADLETSMRAIEQASGVRVRYFAYPYGFGIPQTDDAALSAGMHMLFTLRAGLARPGDPAFYIKRVMVTPGNWEAIRRWISLPATASD